MRMDIYSILVQLVVFFFIVSRWTKSVSIGGCPKQVIALKEQYLNTEEPDSAGM